MLDDGVPSPWARRFQAEPRECDSVKRGRCARSRQPFRGCPFTELNHEADHDRRLAIEVEDAFAPALDLAGNGRMTPGNQAPAAGGDGDAIVADKPAEQAAAARFCDKVERKTTLSRPRRAADQNAGLADRQSGRMDIRATRSRLLPFDRSGLATHRATGSRTTKRV